MAYWQKWFVFSEIYWLQQKCSVCQVHSRSSVKLCVISGDLKKLKLDGLTVFEVSNSFLKLFFLVLSYFNCRNCGDGEVGHLKAFFTFKILENPPLALLLVMPVELLYLGQR